MDRMEPPRLPEDRYRMTAPTLGGFAGAAAILMAAAVIVGSARHVLPESVAILLFLTAVLIFHEPFGGVRRIAFPMIWAALAIYSATLLRRRPTRG